jgi:hypothetical protein
LGARVKLVEGGPGSAAALEALVGGALAPGAAVEGSWRAGGRLERQFRQMTEFTQKLVRASEFRRKEYFAGLDATSVAALERTSAGYRKAFWEESQGRMPPADQKLEAFTRRIYDKPKFVGYEVLIPVWGEVYAYGILLVPKDVRSGERRPVVVVQHGLEGRPQFVIDPPDERNAQVYARFGAALAGRGFIVFAPQNAYIGYDAFRILMRKANPVKLSLFSFIIGQHARILDWLETLSFVDKSRIGFYGLSYGGKTAMRVPAVVERYCLSICSADFNEWIWKNTSARAPYSYLLTGEYEIFEWNLANTANYAEMAGLIAPRPFMVERGHRDGVAPDEWVAYEFAKVKQLYVDLGIGDRAAIEFFDGPHTINGQGTFRFLEHWLRWPAGNEGR